MKNYVLAILAVTVLFVAGCTANGNITGNMAADTGHGQVKAPSFSTTTSDGKQVSLESLTGDKGLVIYFMASWCPTCAKNWPAMNEVYSKYKDQVNLVAISIDPTDTAPVLQKLAQDKGFTFDTIPGNVDIVRSFGVKEQTTKFAIDKDGNIVSSHKGVLDADGWEDLIKSVI